MFEDVVDCSHPTAMMTMISCRESGARSQRCRQTHSFQQLRRLVQVFQHLNQPKDQETPKLRWSHGLCTFRSTQNQSVQVKLTDWLRGRQMENTFQPTCYSVVVVKMLRLPVSDFISDWESFSHRKVLTRGLMQRGVNYINIRG